MPRPVNDETAGPVRVLMVAIGGYGFYYLQTLFEQVANGPVILAGVVDPYARDSNIWPAVQASGVPVADTMDAFYGSGHSADLAVVVSPIHMHVPQSLTALAHGSHVLCDKPMSATVQDGRALIDAERHIGLPVSIGYQWSFSAAIQNLKRDLIDGRYGRPHRVTTLCAWPRGRAYYGRNSWAGRLRDAKSHAWVLDSPANNAMAHFLHNALFVIGIEMTRSAMPASVQAEFYRAYPIESCDTAACRVMTDAGCEIVFLASHATDRAIEPRFRIECDDATITFGETGRDIVATNASGVITHYGDPDATPQFNKLFLAIDQVRRPGRVLCGPTAAFAQTVCVNAMHESVPEVVPFPTAWCDEPDGDRVVVRELADTLLACYDGSRLPGESGVEWANGGRLVDARNYGWYPGGTAPHWPAEKGHT